MSIEQINQNLLVPNELDMALLDAQLARLSRHQIDFADLYFQNSVHESWVLEDGIVKDGSYNIEQGVGVRAVSGEKTGFAYSDELNATALDQAVSAARGIAAHGGDGRFKVGQQQPVTARYTAVNPLNSLPREQKISLLQQMDAFARSLDPAVTQVIASVSGVYEEVLVVATDGTLATDLRPLVRLNCSVLAERNGRRERGSSGGGGRFGYDYFLEDIDGQPRAMSYVKEAVRQAMVNLEAVDAPAGTMPVVLGAGWPGVLLHEAVGHGLEGDFNRKGSSAYAGRIGDKVASELCTIVDDGTLANRRGSLTIDDEGTASGYNVLIENGVLKGYMQDKLNARLMGMAPTGNGRRESYAHLPMPRMTNTYMLAGQTPPEEIIRSVKKGIYAPNFGGGQVDITSGRFVFSASEAYLIENGKLTAPIKGATLIGNGPEAMSQVSMVGNDLSLDAGVGVCGKEGQSVPVGVGQPTLKLDRMTVGGTQ
ncbi:metalloprotease TldD [Oceanimonas baumannii]|uniref:Metalloprotease TldD n=1 Tax=Oceanimonas baumannii TaxID=129578 RepID=A0A235CJD4_9GAMM|nr:metalloprotease TldD [Oceanimonas baumannii]OYD24566.1 metalloprotease TldD [Oceanimonas baumannii]TDW59301.1 TldD protein [Oceanimonas baumannii]